MDGEQARFERISAEGEAVVVLSCALPGAMDLSPNREGQVARAHVAAADTRDLHDLFQIPYRLYRFDLRDDGEAVLAPGGIVDFQVGPQPIAAKAAIALGV